MKIFFTFLIPLLVLANLSFAAPEDEWFNCKSNEECVVTRESCGNPIAVNKNFLAAAEKDRSENAPRVNCSDPGPEDMSPYKAICDYQSTSCPKKNFLGIETGGVDPTSICMSTKKRCMVIQ